MTARAFGEDRADCLCAGMNDPVGKPVEPELLYEVLTRWMPGVGRRAPNGRSTVPEHDRSTSPHHA